MGDEFIIVLEGELAEIMEEIYQSTYRRYVSLGKNRINIPFVRLHKALYGFLCSALLFYRKLKGELEAFGFLLNLYGA